MVNNSTIESMAIAKIKEELICTECVDTSYIKEGDKEPVWDGNIYVYNSKNEHSKENLKYKIPVQIKGTTTPIENNLKYSIGKRELALYLNDGGIFYFIVRIDMIKKHHQVYYISLLPYDLKNLITIAGKNKSISCDINPFPTNDIDKLRVISEFAEHRLLQQGFIHIDEAKVQNFKELIIPVVKIGKNFDLNKFLLNYEGFGYGKTEQGVHIPIQMKRGEITQETLIDGEVSIGNKVYFTRLVRKVNAEHSILVLNDNIEFVIDNTLRGTCTLTYKGGLQSCIEALSFIVELGKYGEFAINTVTRKVIIDKKDINAFKNNLSLLTKLQKALKKCNIRTELQLNSFTAQDIKNINLLIWAIGRNREVELNTTHEIYPFRIFISNQCILCIAIKQSNGRYKLKPFDNNVVLPHKNIKFSPYERLGDVFFRNVINMDYNQILEDVKKYGNDTEHLQIANTFALQVLKAYDETHEEELLTLAISVFRWMEENTTSDKIIYHLNYLQCKIRKDGKIPEAEEDYLHDIIEENNNSMLKFGAYILLRDKHGADRQFKKFNQDTQNNIKQFPIYKLWEQLN